MGWSLQRKPGVTVHNPAYSFKGYTIAHADRRRGGLSDRHGRAGRPRLVVPGRQAGIRLPHRRGHAALPLPGPAQPPGAPFKPAMEDDPPMPLEERARKLPSNYRFLREVGFDGEVLWQHEDPVLHHDFFKTRDDTFLVTRFVQMEKALSDKVRGQRRAKGGHHPMLTDEYLEIDRSGKVVWSVRLDEVLDPRARSARHPRAADRVDPHQLDLPERRRDSGAVLGQERQPCRDHRQGRPGSSSGASAIR